MAPHSSTPAWKIPRTEEPGRLQCMGSLRVRHDWATSLSLFTFIHWKRTWHPTPVFLPGESWGRGSLVGCHLRGRTESDTTEQLHVYFHALEKEMATHSSVLAWRIPETEEPSGLPSTGSHRVGHDWSDLAAAAAAVSNKKLDKKDLLSMAPPIWTRLNFPLGQCLSSGSFHKPLILLHQREDRMKTLS